MRLDIEVLRIFAAFMVVWFHANMHLDLTVPDIAPPFFAGVAGYFAALSKSPLIGKIKTVFMAYVFWALIYSVLTYLVQGKPMLRVDQLLLAPVIHLWFLPFVAMVYVFAKFSGVWVSFAVLLAAVFGIHSGVEMPAPYAQYLNSLPCAMVGIIIAKWEGPKIPIALTLAVAVGLTGLGNAIAAAMLLPLCFSGFKGDIRKFSGLMLGVYLIHPLALFVGVRLLDGFYIVIFAFIASVVAVAILKKTPLRFAV